MSFAHRVGSTLAVAGRGHTYSKEYTADAMDPRQIDVPDQTTDKQVNIAIDYSKLVNLFLVSDQDVTLETNNPGPEPAPDDTISLKANVVLNWNADSYFDCPLTEDVTAIYITNASGAAAIVKMEVLQDSTP